MVQPFSYYEGTTLAGYDVELIYRFGAWLNAEVEIKIYDYDGIIAAAQAGDIDCIMANLNATEERRKHIEFSDCVYPSETAVMVRAGQGNGAVRETGFWAGLKDSFQGTFVEEGRWRLIVQGLGITILISVLSGIFGLCLGFGICMLQRTGYKPVRLAAAVFVRVVQGDAYCGSFDDFVLWDFRLSGYFRSPGCGHWLFHQFWGLFIGDDADRNRSGG